MILQCSKSRENRNFKLAHLTLSVTRRTKIILLHQKLGCDACHMAEEEDFQPIGLRLTGIPVNLEQIMILLIMLCNVTSQNKDVKVA